jgi:hypothetical protein
MATGMKILTDTGGRGRSQSESSGASEEDGADSAGSIVEDASDFYDSDPQESEPDVPVLQGLSSAGCELLLGAHKLRLAASTSTDSNNKGDCIVLRLDQDSLDKYFATGVLAGGSHARDSQGLKVVGGACVGTAGVVVGEADSSGKRRMSKAERKKLKKQHQGAAVENKSKPPVNSMDHSNGESEGEANTSLSGEGLLLVLRCVQSQENDEHMYSHHDFRTNSAQFEMLTKSQACESFITSLAILSRHRK